MGSIYYTLHTPLSSSVPNLPNSPQGSQININVLNSADNSGSDINISIETNEAKISISKNETKQRHNTSSNPLQNSLGGSGNIPKSASIDSNLSNVDTNTLLKRGRDRSHSHSRSSSIQLPLSGGLTTEELIEIEPRFIAEQLTLIDHDNWKAIPISEWLFKSCM